MLVLTRRLGETVVIDGDIQITVVAVQGNKVRLGITAPDAVRVDRQEVWQRLAENSVCVPVTNGTSERNGTGESPDRFRRLPR
jgi:carbon storage regulator